MFWSQITFIKHIPGSETAPERPGAEIPQFTTLVSSPAPNRVALQPLDIFGAFDGMFVAS